jgi:hypothetical protein
MLGRRGQFQSVICAFPYLGRGCIVILAMVAILTSGLSVSVTSSAPSLVSPADLVDRTTKGDRLPLVPALIKRGEQIGPNHHLPVGCEAVASPLTYSSSAHIARRCLS